MKKYVIVTGAGSGIGSAISKELSDYGFTPILTGRTESKLVSLKNELKEDSLILPLDLAKDSSGEKAKEFLNEIEDGKLVGLINNAGIYRPQRLDENEMSVWKTQFQTNLFGAVHLTSCLLPLLKDSKGSIVNISSTLGIRPIESTAAYSASKAAMNNWTHALAIELAPWGVRANVICPGIVETPIHSFYGDVDVELRSQLDSMQPLGRIGQPQDIAPLARLLVSDDSSWITGGVYNIDGGILLKS